MIEKILQNFKGYGLTDIEAHELKNALESLYGSDKEVTLRTLDWLFAEFRNMLRHSQKELEKNDAVMNLQEDVINNLFLVLRGNNNE